LIVLLFVLVLVVGGLIFDYENEDEDEVQIAPSISPFFGALFPP
jgi:hypothetical protein